MFDPIRRIVRRLPLGVEHHALRAAEGGHHRGDRVALPQGAVAVPAGEGISLLDGRGRRGDGRALAGHDHRHITAAVGIKGVILHVGGIAPFNVQRALDRLGGERQRAVLPADRHIAALLDGARVGRDGDCVAGRIVAERAVAQFDGEVALGRVVVVACGILVPVVELAGLHVHIAHVEQRGGQRDAAYALEVDAEPVVVLVIREVVDVLLCARAPQRPLTVVEHRLIGQLVAREKLRLERDGQIQSDLHIHRARGVGLLAAALRPAQMVVEVAPELRVSARLGRDADGVQLEREQADADLELHAHAHAKRTHDVEVEVVVRLLQIDGLVGRLLVEEQDGEIVASGHAELEAHAHRDVEVRLHDKVGADAVAEDVERVHIALLGEDLLADEVDPALVGVLHHRGVFIRKAAALTGLPVHILAEEGFLLFHQILDLLADVDDLFLGRKTGHALPVEAVVVLAGRLGRGGDGDAGVGAHVDVGVEAVIVDVGEDPLPLPDRAAAGVDGEQDLLLEHGGHIDLDGIAVLALHGGGELDGQLGADAVAVGKMLERADVDGRADVDMILIEQRARDRAVQRQVAALHQRAVRVGDGVGRKAHVAQLLEAVRLQRQLGEILRRLLGEAALACLTHHVVLNLRPLRGGQLDLLVAGAVEVHRRENVGFLRALIGEDVVFLAVLRDRLHTGDPRIAPALGLTAQRAGVEGEEVAHVDGRLGIQPHLGVLIVRVGHVLHTDGGGVIVRNAVGVPALIGRERQHVGREKHVRGIRRLIGIGRAAGRRDLHVGHRAVVIRADAAVSRAHALVDRYGVAHGKAACGIGEAASLRHGGDGLGVALRVLHERGTEQAVKARGHPRHVLLGNVLHAVGEREVIHLDLLRDDVQHAHARRLLRAVHHEARVGIRLQLHAVGLALLRRKAHRAVWNVVRNRFVVRRHIDKGINAALGIAADAEGVAAHIRRRNGHGHIVGGLRLVGVDRHDLAQLGVEGHVPVHGVVRPGRAGQGAVVVPAEEHLALHRWGGQRGNARTRGDGRFGHRSALDHEADLIMGRDGRAAGAAAARGLLLLGLLIAALLSAARLDAHALTLHARLGVPGLHGLVRALAERGSLGAGRLILGREIHAVAVKQAQRPQLARRVLRPRGHLVKVGRLCRDRRIGLRHRVKGLKIAHEEDRHLLAGDPAVRRELPVSGAGGDAVARRPLDKGRVPGSLRDVDEVRRAGVVRRLNARHAAEHRDEHRARHRAFRLEGRRAGPVKEAVGAGVQNRRLIPAAALDVGERVLRLCRRRARRLGLARCRLRKALHLVRQNIGGYERDDHAEYQQQADDPFLHTVSPF